MTDSTNPRVMADNIRELSKTQAAQGTDLENKIEVLGSYSTSEVDTGMKYGEDDIYRKILTGTTETYTDNVFSATTVSLGVVKSLLLLRVIVKFGAYLVELPYLNDSGKILKSFYNTVSGDVHLSSNGATFSDCNFIVIAEYTKPAPAPTPNVLLSPDPDMRSLEEEPEPIEEKK